MSAVGIWVHLVFSTKFRTPWLNEQLLKNLCRHIYNNCKENNINISVVNGHKDHLHCLILMKADQSIAGITKQIKAESSRWINANNLVEGQFQWQRQYWADSISNSHLSKIRNYIKNQKQHHKNDQSESASLF